MKKRFNVMLAIFAVVFFMVTSPCYADNTKQQVYIYAIDGMNIKKTVQSELTALVKTVLLGNANLLDAMISKAGDFYYDIKRKAYILSSFFQQLPTDLKLVEGMLDLLPETRDSYLEQGLIQITGLPESDIHSFGGVGMVAWDGNAAYTDKLLEELVDDLRAHYQVEAVQNGKRFVVVSHSWGTFLAVMALKYAPEVKPDLLVTLSTPLGSNMYHDLDGEEFGEYKEHSFDVHTVQRVIEGYCLSKILQYGGQNPSGSLKPMAVDNWVNYWDAGDVISGPVGDLSCRNPGEDCVRPLDIPVNFVSGERNFESTALAHSLTGLQAGRVQSALDADPDLNASYKAFTDDLAARLLDSGSTICFVIDTSGSMEDNDADDIRLTAAKLIIERLNGSERVFIIDFDGKSRWVNANAWRGWDRETLKKAVGGLDHRGGTDIGAGLAELRKALEQTGVPLDRAGVVLLTDGLGDYEDQALWFADNNIPIFTISLAGDENAQLLTDIAVTTGGEYLKAYRDMDIVHGFQKFLAGMTGSTTIAYLQTDIQQGETKQSFFSVDGAMHTLIASCLWRGSTVDMILKSPSGKNYSLSTTPQYFLVGPTHAVVKLPNPEQGRWEANLVGVEIPTGGEPLTFEVSGTNDLAPRLVSLDAGQDGYQGGPVAFTLELPEGLVDPDSIKAEVILITPQGDRIDLSDRFDGMGFSFIPRDGRGSYDLQANISGKRLNGQEFSRVMTRSLFVSDDFPANMGTVLSVQGAFVETSLGAMFGNRVGINCIFLRLAPDGKETVVAKGYVTDVRKDDSSVEVLEYTSGAGLVDGDVIQLDLEEWKND